MQAERLCQGGDALHRVQPVMAESPGGVVEDYEGCVQFLQLGCAQFDIALIERSLEICHFRFDAGRAARESLGRVGRRRAGS